MSTLDLFKNFLELVEICSIGTQAVPQRLKPRRKYSGYGTAEAVPLSKTEYFNKQDGVFQRVS